MSIENLIKQLCNYTDKDLIITGNPKITYNELVCSKLHYKSHTNFSYELVTYESSVLTENSITWNKLNDLGDIVNNVTLFVENFEDLTKIIIGIEDMDPIELKLEYIKIYNLICKQIIF
jgi:hypothetical protein